MKKLLLEMLICPACLPDEIQLNAHIDQEQKDDIVKGVLNCRQCGKIYPIQDGVAVLDSQTFHPNQPAENKYETASVVSSYLWSHYGDLLDEENASDAYSRWAGLMNDHSGLAVDVGAAVGRFTFEMSQKSDFVIGIDNAHAFIRAARELMINRRMTVALKQEGYLTREVELTLPEAWNSDRVEFIVGDALALPFRKAAVSSLASLNLVDKVPFPIKHLEEMNRVTAETGAQFLLSDPFSWSQEVAAEKDWLGGQADGPYSGRGLDNVMALLKGYQNRLLPAWSVETHGRIWWKIRTHDNHFEQIRSCYVKAAR